MRDKENRMSWADDAPIEQLLPARLARHELSIDTLAETDPRADFVRDLGDFESALDFALKRSEMSKFARVDSASADHVVVSLTRGNSGQRHLLVPRACHMMRGTPGQQRALLQYVLARTTELALVMDHIAWNASRRGVDRPLTTKYSIESVQEGIDRDLLMSNADQSSARVLNFIHKYYSFAYQIDIASDRPLGFDLTKEYGRLAASMRLQHVP